MKALTLVLALVSPLCAMTREEFNSRYAEKYLVAMREGLATGICAGHRGGETGMRVDLDFSSARVYQPKAFAILDPGEKVGVNIVHHGRVVDERAVCRSLRFQHTGVPCLALFHVDHIERWINKDWESVNYEFLNKEHVARLFLVGGRSHASPVLGCNDFAFSVQ